MLSSILKTLFGDPGEKRLRSYQKELSLIHAIEARFATEITSVEAVQARTAELKAQFEGLDLKNPDDVREIKRRLDSIKHEAFALHRTACRLIAGQEFVLEDGHTVTWNMVPYDVQLLGALTLHGGNISEMRTGEGKTLVATIAAYLNALAGYPVHVVTVNDYLARRDAMEMGIIYNTLGLSVGIVVHGQAPAEKQENYRRDVVYATNNELGFDYLRDNMVTAVERRSMGPLFFAIIDEVDSILVDEARTPLIISSPDSEPTSKYLKFAQMAKMLKAESHYKIDEKQRTATLTEDGIAEIEKMLGVENIYASESYNDIHHIENALKAAVVYQRDIDYLIRNDEALIIDEHTGRVLAGRRYSDGLHQAIEAKESITIQQESRTLASITFQNYFRLYKKLAGMTGTAKTEEEEFYKIYRLEVITVPTNRPMLRKDKSDLLFKNEEGKYTYLVRLIKELQAKGQPVLVGTVSVAKSELLSQMLEAQGVPHKVLNAKQDANEAEIISQAGQLGAVTIATNMAGRGTDIKISEEVANLKGEVKISEQVYELGGLFVIGTEKHETRRIDNQLRGRSGRQGDPGLSQFMVAPTDDIMRIFGGDKLFSVFNSPMFASVPADEPLAESSMLTSRITTVQKQVEGRNFDIRKHILEYDDVLNQHRLVMYGRRNRILENENIHEEIEKMFEGIAEKLVAAVDLNDHTEEAEISPLSQLVRNVNEFAEAEVMKDEYITDTDPEMLVITVKNCLLGGLETVKERLTAEDFEDFEKKLTLASIDELWMAHIDRMSHLREEVAFEGYAQKNPLVVYKERAYDRFIELVETIAYKVAKGLLSARAFVPIQSREIPLENLEVSFAPVDTGVEMPAPAVFSNENTRNEEGIRVIRASDESSAQALGPEFKDVKRNDLCPCGSGKKFKQCHGR